MLFSCSSKHMTNFLHLFSFSVFKSHISREIKRILSAIYFQRISHYELFFRRTTFLNPTFPFPSQVSAAFFILLHWRGDGGFWESGSGKVFPSQYDTCMRKPGTLSHTKASQPFQEERRAESTSELNLWLLPHNMLALRNFFFWNWLTFSYPSSPRRVTWNS